MENLIILIAVLGLIIALILMFVIRTGKPFRGRLNGNPPHIEIDVGESDQFPPSPKQDTN